MLRRHMKDHGMMQKLAGPHILLLESAKDSKEAYFDL